MSAKRKQPEIKFSSFTPPQRGPAASAILGIQPLKEVEKEKVIEEVKEQTVEDKPIEELPHDSKSVKEPEIQPLKEVEKEKQKVTEEAKEQAIEEPHHEPEPVKEPALEKPERKRSESVETLISGLKKDSFVSRHQKESFYIENDLHETFFDVTSGMKSAKTTLINLALKEFFENHDIEIKKYTGQYATGTRRKKKIQK